MTSIIFALPFGTTEYLYIVFFEGCIIRTLLIELKQTYLQLPERKLFLDFVDLHRLQLDRLYISNFQQSRQDTTQITRMITTDTTTGPKTGT